MSEKWDNPYASVNWENVVPAEKRKLIEVWKPKPAVPVNAIVLSEGITGVYVHWFGRRTGPCLGSENNVCPFCKLDVPRRWEGYLGGYSERTGKVYLIHLSKEAARSCPAIATGKSNLRGSRIIIERKGRAANAPCSARIEVAGKVLHTLPANFDIRAQLMILWEGKGGIAGMMAQCQTFEQAAEMFSAETGYDR